jgi:hypothetical protein
MGMGWIRESEPLLAIKLNEDFRDDGQQYSAQIRLRIEIVVMILEDIEARRRLLHVQRIKNVSGSELEKLVDLMNRAEYHLRELETRIQKPSC